MAKIVVLGAGTGGMPAAYEIKHLLGQEHQVLMVNERENFRFIPSNPWVAVGWREPDAISIPIAKHLAKKHIDFICAFVTKIDADNNQLITAEHDVIDYDYLVIASDSNWHLIQFLGHIQSTLLSRCALLNMHCPVKIISMHSLLIQSLY
ncbi:NAD(P)/FAD-dependent oxidoreductase [Shewanella phaeophyticola]|uniref:FAD-dependent oxidoreductase n=1 Tax=Shewanella phaeophyticola TaxID=2978345 RepID=A0ABT2P2H9_9GAMM|nr:FAD-dependent oxidoreductase [Shewanella sp. KJ10-1]MCT8986677.1 FAD-dependent oxidoreductase [Shewanella sp. KJ10-1]